MNARSYRAGALAGAALATFYVLVVAGASGSWEHLTDQARQDWIYLTLIVGGFGSIGGSLIASLLIGLLDSYLATYYSPLADYSLYLPMVVILVLRPQGLLGRRVIAGADV